MRFLIVAAGITLLTAWPVAAEVKDPCVSFGELAANIMDMRQSGVVMSKAMSSIPDDNPAKPLAVALIKEAYGKPQYRTPENQRQEVTDFRNDAEYACYTSTD